MANSTTGRVTAVAIDNGAGTPKARIWLGRRVASCSLAIAAYASTTATVTRDAKTSAFTQLVKCP
jgi:hypothetical protein